MKHARHPSPDGSKRASSDLPFPTQADKIASNAHRVFLYTVFGGMTLLVAWAGLTELDTVTRGSGQVVPALQNQFVQHLEGGIVSEILVKEGQEVEKGDVLMRIQDSFSQAEFSRSTNELKARRAELARLDAETEGQDFIIFPEDLTNDVPELIENERKLFKRRQSSFNEQLLILKDQSRQKRLELSELQSREKNTKLEYDLIKRRVDNLRRLAKRGGVSRNDLLQSETILQQIRTTLGDLKHQIPQAVAELSEANRREREAGLSQRSESETSRSETLRAIKQLKETLHAMQDRSARSDLRAPISGTVHRLFLTTIGGVVRTGQNLAQIVPTDAPIGVEVRLSPADRAKVWPDLPSVVKLTAYDSSIFGSLKGKVTDISSDVIQDDGGDPYYRVRLEVDTKSFGADKPIVAGMLADVDILTGKRSVLNYLLKPARTIVDKAFRES